MMKKTKAVKPAKPFKNYVILGVILTFTIIVAIYLCLWYQEYRAYQDRIPVLRGVVPEITEIELSHYVQESDRAVVYFCSPSNETCRHFENDFKKMILKRELKDSIIYLNLENDNHANVVLKDLIVQYQITEPLTTYPGFLLFVDGKVEKVLQGSTYTNLSLNEVEQFLETYKID